MIGCIACIIELLVNGQWGPWGGYGSCSKTCDPGKKVRIRRCRRPRSLSQSRERVECVGSDREETACNIKGCPGNRLSYSNKLRRNIFLYSCHIFILIYPL